MIENVGIDIVQIKRIKLNLKFINKVLHPDEILIFHSLSNKQRQQQFLAGRWAVKEAIIKASSVMLPFTNINVSYQQDKPVVSIVDFSKTIKISITHENKYAVAIAIIEK